MEKRPSDLEQKLLYAIIDVGEEAYAVPIQERLEQVTGKPISDGAVYTMLARVVEKRFVDTRMTEPLAERGGKRRKLYKVNAIGMKALEAIQAENERGAAILKRLRATWSWGLGR